MPNIDSDLFQVLTLALLFFSLLALLAALSVLNGIKKQLDSGRGAAPQPAVTYQQQTAPAAYEPAPAAYEPAPAYEAQPQPVQEVSTGFVSMTEAAPATAGATGVAGTALRGDEPEEQPFERDGRWWFKRGGELLVYDEGTGQWVASTAASAAPAATSAATATTTLGSISAGVTERADTGEGWKCAACGAVNGSTATSCRMCFAPR